MQDLYIQRRKTQETSHVASSDLNSKDEPFTGWARKGCLQRRKEGFFYRNYTKKISTKNGVLKRRKILLGKLALQRNSSEANPTE